LWQFEAKDPSAILTSGWHELSCDFKVNVAEGLLVLVIKVRSESKLPGCGSTSQRSRNSRLPSVRFREKQRLETPEPTDRSQSVEGVFS
jgi:hypothetical protein